MAAPSPDRPADDAKLQGALARLLRPLVRLFIRRGLTFPVIAGLLRELYVNVAEHEFALPGKAQTDSRVSLLTGIHRKEISRLRGAGAPVTTVPAGVSRSSRIMARWLADAAFADPNGEPAALPRLAGPGVASFETLVAAVTRDVRPRAVLDEWLDRKLVRLDDDDRVTLCQEAFVPRGGDEQQLYYFGRNLHDHIAAAVVNISEETPRFLERAVHYDGLSAELAATLEERARALAMEALRQANREAHAACETDAGGAWRWNFGIYVYAEPAAPPSSGEDSAESTP